MQLELHSNFSQIFKKFKHRLKKISNITLLKIQKLKKIILKKRKKRERYNYLSECLGVWLEANIKKTHN